MDRLSPYGVETGISAKGGRAAYRFGNSAEARTLHYGFRAVRTAW